MAGQRSTVAIVNDDEVPPTHFYPRGELVLLAGATYTVTAPVDHDSVIAISFVRSDGPRVRQVGERGQQTVISTAPLDALSGQMEIGAWNADEPDLEDFSYTYQEPNQ